jgi:hypothetical protein
MYGPACTIVKVSFFAAALTLFKEAKDRFCPCFSETLKNIKIIEKNLIFAEKYRNRTFQIKTTKRRKIYFL